MRRFYAPDSLGLFALLAVVAGCSCDDALIVDLDAGGDARADAPIVLPTQRTGESCARDEDCRSDRCSGDRVCLVGYNDVPCESDEDCNISCSRQNVCVGSIACGAGFCDKGSYCSSENACASDCVTNSDCPSLDQTCSIHGECVMTGCADVQVSLDRIPPTVMILADRSGSMDATYGVDNESRWDGLVRVIADPTDGLVYSTPGVVFGAASYTSYTKGANNGLDNDEYEDVPREEVGSCPFVASVTPGLDSGKADEIRQMFLDYPIYFNGGGGGTGDTPTGFSLNELVGRDNDGDPVAPSVFDGVQGEKVIVLITDGDPDRCDDNPGSTQNEVRGIVESTIEDLFDTLGITTYVVFIGEQPSGGRDAHLRRGANLGQGFDADDATQRYLVATNPQDLKLDIDSITLAVQDCVFELDQEANVDRAADGRVTLNGEPLSFGDDWRLNSPSELEILGPSCEQLKSGGAEELAASFPCSSLVR